MMRNVSNWIEMIIHFWKKTPQLSNMIIAVWSVFMRDEGSKYYPQVLYKLVEYYVNVRTW